MAEDHCGHEKGPPPRHLQSWLGLHLRGRRLQLGADAEPRLVRGSIRITEGRSVSVQPKTGSPIHKRPSPRSSAKSQIRKKNKAASSPTVFQQTASNVHVCNLSTPTRRR